MTVGSDLAQFCNFGLLLQSLATFGSLFSTGQNFKSLKGKFLLL